MLKNYVKTLMNSLSWVEVNTAAIRHNILQVRSILPKNCKIAAVIKSNAYGHGIIPLAAFLQKNKLAEYLAVANDLEALCLRTTKIRLPIIVLSYWDEKNLPALLKNKIELAVYSMSQIKTLTDYVETRHCLVSTLKIHLKIDTGMHRLGFCPAEIEWVMDMVRSVPQLEIQGIFSHFAAADEDGAFTKKQLRKFNEVVAKVAERGKLPLLHIANSAGMLFMKGQNFNLARAGIALYGLQPSAQKPQFHLKPALTWKTKVIQVKNIRRGEKISYSLTYEFKRDAHVAVLPVGYADGYDRKLSNCGEVLIRGKRYPVRGRVCMNLTMVEVDDNVKEGDEVVLIGKQKDEEVTADELAQTIGTINYEVVTRISSEIERIYK
jgi:alanine racemase